MDFTPDYSYFSPYSLKNPPVLLEILAWLAGSVCYVNIKLALSYYSFGWGDIKRRCYSISNTFHLEIYYVSFLNRDTPKYFVISKYIIDTDEITIKK